MSSSPPPLCQRERGALCDLLEELGPDAPTLCEGWRSADLGAHLYVRDRRPDAGPGMALKLAPLASWSDRVQKAARDTMPWENLIGAVRSGPPPWLRPLDPAINTVEYFVHHEDLRRAQPGWGPRSLAPEDEAELWRHGTGLVKLQGLLTRLWPGHHPAAARLVPEGSSPVVISQGPGPTVKGRPGEIVLWLMGRRQVAQVELS